MIKLNQAPLKWRQILNYLKFALDIAFFMYLFPSDLFHFKN